MDDYQEAIKKLTTPQAKSLYLLSLLYPDSRWHFNDCGCCVCLHPNDGDNSKGYIIGDDGEYSYVDANHGEE